MSMNLTPSGERIHIGIFGNRNAGKSSIINALTGQNLAIVSDVLGTTTDPVYKAMELLPLGPIVLIDTPGIDDEGELGKKRVEKAYNALAKSDIALLVTDSTKPLTNNEQGLIDEFKKRGIPYLILINKADLCDKKVSSSDTMYVSAKTGFNIKELKDKLGTFAPKKTEKHIIADLVKPNDVVILVVPIDESAPKGRIILPQQMVIRDLLEAGAGSLVVRETELEMALKCLKEPPSLVVTDSQAFEFVSKIVPTEIPLTSFSILMARYKGDLDYLVSGAKGIDLLKDGDTVLISEGCTHHRQCKDIGTVKLPAWLKKYTGKELNFEYTSGVEFPKDTTKYAQVIHCGGCMLNEAEVKSRISNAKASNVYITNYGTAIAYMNGILERTIKPLKNIVN